MSYKFERLQKPLNASGLLTQHAIVLTGTNMAKDWVGFGRNPRSSCYLHLDRKEEVGI
jgi:hypothetical protein